MRDLSQTKLEPAQLSVYDGRELLGRSQANANCRDAAVAASLSPACIAACLSDCWRLIDDALPGAQPERVPDHQIDL
jgi:hypothetical protein